MNEDLYLDEDGYPTETSLEMIKNWDYNDLDGWFQFIKSLWTFGDWGWHEAIGPKDSFFDEKEVKKFNISTGGWSGNESIIKAMEENDLAWCFSWLESRRGGHYKFEIPLTDKKGYL